MYSPVATFPRRALITKIVVLSYAKADNLSLVTKLNALKAGGILHGVYKVRKPLLPDERNHFNLMHRTFF